MGDPDEIAMFHSQVAPYDRSDPAAHAFWTGPRTGGYGMVGHEWAHRLAFRLHHGEDSIPPGSVIRHRCPSGPVRSCVRIEHLEVGTQTENMADMVEAGRTSVLGPVSEADVVAIRWCYSTGRFSQGQLAVIFWGDGSGQARISKIVNGVIYADYPGPITRRGQGNRPPRRTE